MLRDQKIRTAVIGVGHQGRWHADKFAALQESELVAVVDTDAERCRSVAGDLDTAALEDYHQLVGQVDAVSIASPTSSHFDIASFLLRNGIHVLIEKPIAKSLDQAATLVELAESHDRVLQVGHLERFNPALLTISEALDEPQFIESTRIAPFSNRSVDISVVLDLMIHDIDLVHAIVQSPVKSVDAMGAPVISDEMDIANARLRFENGCVANVTASRVGFKRECMLRIFQRNAYFAIDLLGKKLTVHRKTRGSATFDQQDITSEKQAFGKSDALMTQSKAFLASVSGGEPPIVSGQVGMRALGTALKISEMMQRG